MRKVSFYLKKILFCVFIISVVITKVSADQKPPVIYTWNMPFYNEGEENSPFLLFVKELEKRINVKFEIKVYAPKLSISYFQNDKESLLFPASNLNLPTNIKIVKSVPVLKKSLHAFVLQDKKIPSKLKELYGKEVALVRGYSYPFQITDNNNIFISYTKNAMSSMKKLQEGAVEIVLNDSEIGKEAITKANLDNIIYDENKPFTMIDIFFACHRTKRGSKRIKFLSRVINEMQKDKMDLDYFSQASK